MDQSGDLDGLIRNDTLRYFEIKNVKDLIKRANDPELVEPLNTIFDLYDKAYQLTPNNCLQQPVEPFFVMKNEEQEIVIQSLQKISRQFKEKTADDKCHDLFILMMINTYFSVRDINNITFDSYSLSIFFNLINYYFNPQPITKDSSNIDFYLIPNFTTFMACQLYLGQLLTPVYSRQCTYMSPKFDDFWKNTSLDPAKSKPSGIISRYIDLFSITNPNGFGSNLYRSVLSPIQGMVLLFQIMSHFYARLAQ